MPLFRLSFRPIDAIGSRSSGRAIALIALAAVCSLPAPASAQWFGFGRNRCRPCEAPAPAYRAAYQSAYQTAYAGDCGCNVAAAPVVQQTACVTPVVQQTACVAVQPVQQTVYQQVPVTKYRKVAKTERRPVYKTAYEEREVTVMQQQYEQRTAEVPYTTYQSVTEFRPQTIDRSHWQTVYRPNQKISSCRADCRPGFAGWWGRTRNDIRNAFTPDRVATRQFVPDVRQAMVPVTRQVPITASRTVTYNVAKMVPVKTKQRVAVLKQEFEDVPVTAYEPYTTTETVAVGTRMQMAYIGGGATATAASPTPARTASETPVRRKASANTPGKQASNRDEPFQLNSLDPLRHPADTRRFDAVRPQGFERPDVPKDVRLDLTQTDRWSGRDAATADTSGRDPRAMAGYRPRKRGTDTANGWASRTTPTVLKVAGWKPVRSESRGPGLNVALSDRN